MDLAVDRETAMLSRVKWRLEIVNPRRNVRKKMRNMKEVDICSLLNWEAHL